jgi:hypothetical protein
MSTVRIFLNHENQSAFVAGEMLTGKCSRNGDLETMTHDEKFYRQSSFIVGSSEKNKQ